MSSKSGGAESVPHQPGRPLEGKYPPMLVAAVTAMIPFIITSTAWEILRQGIGKELGIQPVSLELISSMGTAGYAFGALMGGDLINRYPQRKLFLLLETVFVIGVVLAATSFGAWQLGVGTVLQGLSTGLLLVVALPPVVRRFGPEKMPYTSAAINMGFFGAITAGPLVGGAFALIHAWRWYYAAQSGLGLLILLLAALSLPDQEPMNPGKPFDWHALVLGLGATVLPFYGAAVLATTGFAGYRFTVPMGVGLICFVALILTQYHKDEPLSPVKPMWHSFPIIGTLIAMFGGGLFIALLELGMRFLSRVQHQLPVATGLAFWPMLPTVVVTAAILGLLIRTRWLPVLILAGMSSLALAAVLLGHLDSPRAGIMIPVAGVLLGLGAGATVSPGLWLAGFSLPSKMVGRIFALVELVRSVADFILAPVFLEIAHLASHHPEPTAAGIAQTCWYVVWLAAGASVVCIVLYLMGKPGLPKPDLGRWLKKSEPAWDSPPLLTAVRGD